MEFVSGNIFIREMEFVKNGDVVQGHKHNFDHTTYVTKGEVLVEALDDAGNVLRSRLLRAADGRNWVLIKAENIHRLTCQSEGGAMAHCIYSHRSPQGDVVEHYDGWPKAYV